MHHCYKVIALLVGCLFITATSNAEIKTYTHTVKQSFGGAQSPDDARIAAIAKAKREVLEQAGTYLESMTVVQEGSVTIDQITSIAAGVLKVEIISQENYVSGDAFGIKVVSKVDVDISYLEVRVDQLLQNKCAFDEYQDSDQSIQELLAKIEFLESENKALRSLVGDPKKQKQLEIEKGFDQAAKSLEASELYQKARSLWAEDHYGKESDARQAIEYLNRSIELDPSNAYAYNQRGLAHKELKEYELALEDHNRAIAMKPDYFCAFNNRGVIYKRLGKHEKALDEFNTAIDINFEFSLGYANRGVVYKNMGDKKRALEDLNKAVELDGKNKYALNNRGILFNSIEKYDDAIADFNAIIEMDSKHKYAHYNRGLSLYKKQEYKEALVDFDAAIKIDPEYVKAYNYRGIVNKSMGNYEAAIEDYDTATQIDPSFRYSYNNRAWVYKKLERYDEAVEDYSKAIELDAKYANAYYGRGLSYEKLGQTEKAEIDFRNASRLDPKKYEKKYKNRGKKQKPCFISTIM